ncbi:MAG: EamA family transporter [Candidatus Riflebacteria bacterium]|nr:EamA family transporter [Candidatus Riflebacteria bacterium]
MTDHTRGLLMVLTAATLWSSSGICVKLLPEVGPMLITGWRSVFTLAWLVALFVWLHGSPVAAGAAFRGRLLRPAIWGSAVAYALMLVFFIAATRLTTAANAIFLQYTAPLHVALLSWPILGERLRPRDWLPLGGCILGMVLFFGEKLEGSGLLGNVLGIVSGVACGANAVFLRLLSRAEPPVPTAPSIGHTQPTEPSGQPAAFPKAPAGPARPTPAPDAAGTMVPPLADQGDIAPDGGWEACGLPPGPPTRTTTRTTGSGPGPAGDSLSHPPRDHFSGLRRALPAILLGNALTVLICLPWMAASLPTPFVLLVLAGMGFFQLGIPYSLFMVGLTHVTALEAMVLGMVEAVLNPVWTALGTSERPSLPAVAGGLLILASILVFTLFRSRGGGAGTPDETSRIEENSSLC